MVLTCVAIAVSPLQAFLSSHVSPFSLTPTRYSFDDQMRLEATASDAARNLLYQDQQEAMLRRAMTEEELLAPRTSLLQAPKIKPETPRGTGFAASQKSSTGALLAAQQAKVLKKEGVLLVENVLSSAVADDLRAYVLEQQQLAQIRTEQDPSLARSFYGVEQARAFRCDLQLSLLRGGFHADQEDHDGASEPSHVLADALNELFGDQGTLSDLYENLVTPNGELYELAAVVTHPGSKRQTVHPDLPFQKEGTFHPLSSREMDCVSNRQTLTAT